MQDGIPLEMDWIGFPTIYYIPVPQTIGSVQMIRAGSGLLYGPEPQPVINFVSQLPSTRPLAGPPSRSVEATRSSPASTRSPAPAAIGTTWRLFAPSVGRATQERRLRAERGRSTSWYQFDSQKLSIDFHAYSLDSGLAGLMTGAQFLADRNQTTTPDDRLWTDRYTTVLTYENKFSDKDSYTKRYGRAIRIYGHARTLTPVFLPPGLAPHSAVSASTTPASTVAGCAAGAPATP